PAGSPLNNPAPDTQQVGVNVFQGTTAALPDGAGDNFQGVQFANISFNEPGDGVFQLLHITNLRINAAQRFLALPPSPSSIPITATVTATGLTISNSQVTAAYLIQGAGFATRAVDDSGMLSPSFPLCSSHNHALLTDNTAAVSAIDFNLRFTEPFAYGFMKKLAGSAQDNPEFAYFTESGFVNPAFGGDLAQAGLADTPTRLMAQFTGVPSGVKVFVTISPSPNGTDTSLNARLVSADSNGIGGTDTAATTSLSIAGHTVGVAPVALTNGAGTAVWEIRSANALNTESVSFGVAFAYDTSAGTTEALPGEINGWLAPIDPGGAGTEIPRFSTAGAFMVRQPFEVTPCASPKTDLTIGAITAPATAAPDGISASASIQNIGTADAGAFRVQLGIYADAALTT